MPRSKLSCCAALADAFANRSPFGLLVRPRHSPCSVGIFILIFNIILTPFVLISKYIYSFILPFISSIFTSIASFFCRCCLQSRRFRDPQFTPSDESLGNIQTSKKDIVWIRINDLNADVHGPDRKTQMQLFGTSVENDSIKRGFCAEIAHMIIVKTKRLLYSRIEAEDILQGALGDCWLLSSLAALSEQPHYIRNMFLTPQFNPQGKYRIRIFDPVSARYVTVVIDDYIPCHKATKKPVFSSPKGKEAWVMLLEKAFAKYQGSYANIEGHAMLYALVVCTGCNGNHFERTSKGWQKFDLVVKPPKEGWRMFDRFKKRPKHPTPTTRDDVYLSSNSAAHKRNDHEMFDLMVKLINKRCILAAGAKGEDRTILMGRDQGGGIIPGHAYSILRAYKPTLTTESGLRLVKLRNPWGSFEWNGDWSDKSEQWKMYPGVKAELWPNLGDNDGCFWMAWEDFLKYFNAVDVIYAGGDGLDGLNIDINEEFGSLGPCFGCLYGTLKYWLCCLGPYMLWCKPQERKDRTLDDIETGTLEKIIVGT